MGSQIVIFSTSAKTGGIATKMPSGCCTMYLTFTATALFALAVRSQGQLIVLIR